MNLFHRILAVLCAVCLVAGLLYYAAAFSRAQESETVPETGGTLLRELEERDPENVEAILRTRAAEKATPVPTSAQTTAAPGTTGAPVPSSVPVPPAPATGIWANFRNYVVLGDSRAVGFHYYHFLDKNRVLASGGHTIRNIAGHTAQIQKINPSVIYICYGVNDAGIGYWKTGEAYAAEFMTILTKLQAAVPRAQIVVSSILPAAEHTFQRSPSWRKIPDFNACVKRECAAHGFAYADNDAIAASLMATLYQPDGVHLRPAFYPYWAENLLNATQADAGTATQAPSETPGETPGATPDATPDETPSATPSATPDATPTPTPSPSPDPSPETEEET